MTVLAPRSAARSATVVPPYSPCRVSHRSWPRKRTDRPPPSADTRHFVSWHIDINHGETRDPGPSPLSRTRCRERRGALPRLLATCRLGSGAARAAAHLRRLVVFFFFFGLWACRCCVRSASLG